ncbi:uncharacterized protein MELLADRAFT_58423 [Melampsora larici-populina 98AG31]|uniref:Secreted protein n=1 Tax=Melampsora larici-populina (strain 98AG31 / pathotype 3-4-7) TaxID=747676 RepID=F4R3H1_MELLP|nr:uncharacterized protein MELLADRAFT_58423 [Melampsora larici-populina 98AG31]EGG12627.1 secreted protein [Melampsora larici-populina 98AG31]
MLFSFSVIGCAILAPSFLFVASSPSPQTSSEQSSMNSMGNSTSSNVSTKHQAHQSSLANTDGDETDHGISYDNNATHSSPGTVGRAVSNERVLATIKGGRSAVGARGGARGGAYRSDAHLPIPMAGWALLSVVAGISSLVL